MSSVNLVVNFLLFYYAICNFRYVFYLKIKTLLPLLLVLLLFVFIPFPDVWITPFLLSPNPYGALLNPLAKYPNRTLFVPLFPIGRFET